MARTAREWTTLDKRVSNYFNRLKSDKGMTYRAMSEKSGIVFTRIQRILEQSGGVPTLDEFTDMCFCFDISPSETLKLVLDDAEPSPEIRTHPERFTLVAKRGDIEREQEMYNDLP